jgi:hypothetical protein
METIAAISGYYARGGEVNGLFGRQLRPAAGPSLPR